MDKCNRQPPAAPVSRPVGHTAIIGKTSAGKTTYLILAMTDAELEQIRNANQKSKRGEK